MCYNIAGLPAYNEGRTEHPPISVVFRQESRDGAHEACRVFYYYEISSQFGRYSPFHNSFLRENVRPDSKVNAVEHAFESAVRVLFKIKQSYFVYLAQMVQHCFSTVDRLSHARTGHNNLLPEECIATPGYELTRLLLGCSKGMSM